MRSVIVVFSLVCAFAPALSAAYSVGAPSCDPPDAVAHSPMQAGTGGFYIWPSSYTYTPGGSITVTLTGPKTYKGALVWAHLGAGHLTNTNVVGTWAPPTDWQHVTSCAGDAVTQTANRAFNPLAQDLFGFTPPASDVGAITVEAIVVVSTSEWYWLDQVTLTTVSPSTTTLASSLNPSHAGQSVTFTATVSGGSAPSGTVEFLDGAAAISGCEAVTVNASTAQCPTSTLSLGTHSITAVYSGDANYVGSTSNAVSQSVIGAATHDFSSDGRPDLLWTNTATGASFLWPMNGLVLGGQDQWIMTTNWKIVGIGDFNGDGYNDLVWRDPGTGATYVWYERDGAFYGQGYLFTVDPVWQIEAVADFNNDGHPDFLFRNATTGVGFVWYFNDLTPIGSQFLYSIPNNWIVEAVGDFDGDGYPDFFFRNTDPASGLGFVWLWNGTALGASYYMFSIDPVWQVVQIADWNGDGKPDLLFRNSTTGVVFVWYTDGTSLQGSDFLFQIDPSWEIVPHH